MNKLAQGLRQLDYHTNNYSYPSRRYSLATQAEYLATHIRTHFSQPVSIVAHSMGGLVLRHLAATNPELIKQAVTISTPHQGSHLARYLKQTRWRWILGEGFEQGLDGKLPDWPSHIPLAGIAGSHPVGLGRLFVHFDEPNDGTVRVSEAYLSSMKDRCVLPYSHTGILFAKEVPIQISRFFRLGCFSGAQQPI
ncbi:MAG: alpha/beta fold hydrolase [Gammaproteobacteria bacterium]|nr:alpha/beta fold hydrolase [Gammaproteobacteria bacterium]